MADKNNFVSTTIHLREDLLERLKEHAQDNETSIKNQFNMILEQYFYALDNEDEMD